MSEIDQFKILQHNQNIFKLYRVSNHAKLNKMDEGNLAVCWWPNIFHPKIENLHKVQTDTSLCEVVRISIKQNQFIFHGKQEVEDFK